MEVTVSAMEIKQDITLPMGSDRPAQLTDIKPETGKVNQVIGHYKLEQSLCVTDNSELWLGSDQLQNPVAVKISKGKMELDIYRRLAKLKCKNLVPILEYGEEAGYCYEVMPYYKNGSLQGKFDENIIRDTILPALINALKELHENHLIHNDIKPENLLWDDEKKDVLLGDYGCVAEAGTLPKGFSVSYVAPELLLGNPSKISSDWVSVGLTLGTLLIGEKIVKAETKAAAVKWWEKSFTFRGGSNAMDQLINGMIQRDIKRRLGPKAAKAWIDKCTFGAEARTRHRTEEVQKKKVLIFENPHYVVEDTDGFLLAAEHYWEHLIFLLESGKAGAFLRGLNEAYYHYFLTIKRKYGAEQVLFMLTYYLAKNQYFIWRGVKYTNLADLEQTWEENPEAVREFLLNGSVEYVLETEGASAEELDYIEELMKTGRFNPEKACQLLFIALHGAEEFVWEGVTYYTAEQLVHDICSAPEKVNETVGKLLQSSRFSAWMTFLGFGNFVERILKRCRES